MMNKRANLFVNSFVGMLLSYIVTYIVHSYAHSLAAWWYGLNNTPWVIKYSSLWLQNVTENMGLDIQDQQGSYYTVGIIGLAGYCANWVLIWIALFRFRFKINSKIEICFYYWLFVWSLATIFNYIPHHMLGSTVLDQTFDDMGISSVWLIYLAGGAGALCMILMLFYSLLFKVFNLLDIDKLPQRRIYFTMTLLITFFYNGLHYGWAHLNMLGTSAGIFIWFKLIAFAIMFYTIDLKKK